MTTWSILTFVLGVAAAARVTVFADGAADVRINRGDGSLTGAPTRVRIEEVDSDGDGSVVSVVRGAECWSVSWPTWANLSRCEIVDDEWVSATWQRVERVRFNGTRVDVFRYRGSADATRVPLPLPLPVDATIEIVADRAWRREFTHTGFHGVLATSVASACRVTIVELLPRGVYVDVYQLRGLEAFDARRPRAAVADVIDLEVPTYSPAARDFAVRLAADSDGNVARFELPLHGRYQRPHEDRPYTSVALGAPLVFEQCGAQPWQLLPAADAEPLEWRLPNGLLSHLALVTWGTISTTVLGGTAVVASVLLAHNR